MEQSRGFSRRALGGGHWELWAGTPQPCHCSAFPGLPHCPHSALVLAGFPQAPFSLLFSPSIDSGLPESEAKVSLGSARRDCGSVTPGHPMVLQSRGSWCQQQGHCTAQNSSGLVCSMAQSTPGVEVHPQHRCPQMQRLRVGGTVGTHLAGIPSKSPSLGKERLPATLSSAAEPRPASAFDKGALSNKG